VSAFLRRFLFFAVATLAGLALIVAAAVAVAYVMYRPQLDALADSDRFRESIGEETSRGLKVEGEYGPFTHEKGGWTVATPSWKSTGRPGEAIARLDAKTITGRFNPWGVLRRRWQIDLITIDEATLKLRRPDPDKKVPLPVHPKPWYGFVLPQRMYLKLVDAKKADILWDFKKREAGIHDIHLWVTPYGKKDWRFQGTEGKLDFLPDVPAARVVTMSLVVTKPTLTVESLEIAPPDPDDPGRIVLHGTAGLQPEDTSLDATGKIDRMPLTPWLTSPWDNRVSGRLNGTLSWKGPDTKLDQAEGHGTLQLTGGTLRKLAALDQLALLSGDDSLRGLDFDTASLAWEWNEGVLDIRDLEIEASGKVRAEGTIHSDHGVLSGTIRLGLKPGAVAWLPPQGRSLFAVRDGSPYLWAKVTLSGTLQAPRDDLGPRLKAAVYSSPGTILKIMGKEIGSWFSQ
jgi:hypothetical protein